LSVNTRHHLSQTNLATYQKGVYYLGLNFLIVFPLTLKGQARNIYFLSKSLTVIVFGNLPKILHFNKLFCVLVKCFGDFFRHKLCLHKVVSVTHQCCVGSKKICVKLIRVSIWVNLGRLSDKSRLYLV